MCGSNGVTYDNPCEAQCAGVTYTHGACYVPTPTPTPEPGLIFHESFDNASSITTNGGTVTGTAAKFTGGIYGNAIDLTSGGYVDYPITGTAARYNAAAGTISFWVSTPSSAVGYFDIGRMLSTTPNSMGIYYPNNGYVISEMDSGINQAWSAKSLPGVLPWHLITLTWYKSSSTCEVATTYIDGVPGAAKQYCNSFNPDLTKDMWVGRANWYGNSNAKMDEFKIYNYTKTPTQVLTDYATGVAAMLTEGW